METSFIFKPKNEQSKFIWSETKNSNLFYNLSKPKKANFFWSETRNSNLFYIIGLKTRKAKKLEIQTSFIFSA